MPRHVHQAAPRVGEETPGLTARSRIAKAERDHGGDRVEDGDGGERDRRAEAGHQGTRERRADDARDDVALAVDRVRPLPQRRRRSEEHTSELQSRENLVCRLLLEKKKKKRLLNLEEKIKKV